MPAESPSKNWDERQMHWRTQGPHSTSVQAFVHICLLDAQGMKDTSVTRIALVE